MTLIRIHEKPNAVPVNASVFVLSTQVNGVWYDQKVTWEQLKGLIGALDNLENYYKKSETYTKTEVNQLIAQIPTFSIEIVQQLPTTDISTTTIYLVPKQTAGTLDYYDEFINLDGTTSGWEWLGKTEIDLSNYYTKSETEAYVKGDGADYIAGTKTFSSLTTTAKTILGAINEAAGAASGAQADATQALSDASAAQGTANSASSAASAAQGTADNALTAAGNAASAASAAQGTANTALTTAQSMAVSVTNTLTPGDTTKKVADVTQNSTTTPIYADDSEKVVVALTDEQTTAPGNPVTLTTVQEGGAKSALVTFAPKQSGTGDPSPTNIRPFVLWDGLNLNVSGTNLWDEEWLNETKDIDTTTGELVNTTAYYFRSKNYIPVFPNTTIYNVNGMVSGNYRFFFYDKNKNYLSYVSSASNATLNIPTNACYMLFRFVSNNTTTYQNNISINYPATDTEYHAYQGETHTATFPETITGGSYDFSSGEGQTQYEKADLSDSVFSWVVTSWGAYRTDIPSIYLSDVESYLVCEKYKRVSYNNLNGNKPPNCYAINQNRLFVTSSETPSGGAAFELATPTPISLTPADVNLLKGSNTVWTDGDAVQVKYSELPNGNLGAVIDYIKKLEARIAALES